MNLIELREIFRQRMRERDFCIGEEQVEELFRELLNEPQPVTESKVGSTITATQLNEMINEHMKHVNLEKIFEKDSTFYKYFK